MNALKLAFRLGASVCFVIASIHTAQAAFMLETQERLTTEGLAIGFMFVGVWCVERLMEGLRL